MTLREEVEAEIQEVRTKLAYATIDYSNANREIHELYEKASLSDGAMNVHLRSLQEAHTKVCKRLNDRIKKLESEWRALG